MTLSNLQDLQDLITPSDDLISVRALLQDDVNADQDDRVGGARGPDTVTGLSTYHISPQGLSDTPGSIAIWYEGSKVKVTKNKSMIAQKKGGHQLERGTIKQFSFASRRRLMRKLAETKKGQRPLFITLTYPGEYSTNPDVWKRDFDTIWKRIERRFPHACGIWKLEAQRRGAPHYHLLVWNIDYKKVVLWIKTAWYEVVRSGDERHLRAGTRVEIIRSWNGVMSYASKYMGKIEELPGWESPGRFWGIRNKEFIPTSDIIICPLTYKQACQLMRYLRRFCHIKGRSYPSLTGLVDGKTWLDRIDELVT